jgi:hypothetical protein
MIRRAAIGITVAVTVALSLVQTHHTVEFTLHALV